MRTLDLYFAFLISNLIKLLLTCSNWYICYIFLYLLDKITFVYIHIHVCTKLLHSLLPLSVLDCCTYSSLTITYFVCCFLNLTGLGLYTMTCFLLLLELSLPVFLNQYIAMILLTCFVACDLFLLARSLFKLQLWSSTCSVPCDLFVVSCMYACYTYIYMYVYMCVMLALFTCCLGYLQQSFLVEIHYLMP